MNASSNGVYAASIKWRCVMRVLGVAILVSPATLRAQSTGLLVRDTSARIAAVRAVAAVADTMTRAAGDSARKAQRAAAIVAESQVLRKRFGREMNDTMISQFAKLLVDPSLTSALRASSWGVSIGSTQSAGEVKIQANLADLISDSTTDALSLSLIGPLDSSNPATDLVDLDGLVGTTRAELAWTSDILNANWKHPSFSISATGAAPRFDYRPTATGTEQSTRKPTYAIEGGISTKSVRLAFGAGLRYEDLYKASDEQSICTPVDAAGSAETCKNVVVGAPAHSKTTVAKAEVRWQFGKYTAASLNANYDIKNSVTGLALPIWVFPDIAGGFGGGIRFGYASDGDHHFSVAIFVGQFKL